MATTMCYDVTTMCYGLMHVLAVNPLRCINTLWLGWYVKYLQCDMLDIPQQNPLKYSLRKYVLLLNNHLSLAVTITNGPMNVTVCSGTKARIPCGFTGVSDPFSSRRWWFWRIIKRNDDGHVVSNKTVNVLEINNNRTDNLGFVIHISGNDNSAKRSYLSVGPVDDTYNNTSYQCIFAIKDYDVYLESDTIGTITVFGMYVFVV